MSLHRYVLDLFEHAAVRLGETEEHGYATNAANIMMRYVLYGLNERTCGTTHASTKLNSQFAVAGGEMAFARTFIGEISAVYVHETWPMVMANEQTVR